MDEINGKAGHTMTVPMNGSVRQYRQTGEALKWMSVKQ